MPCAIDEWVTSELLPDCGLDWIGKQLDGVATREDWVLDSSLVDRSV